MAPGAKINPLRKEGVGNGAASRGAWRLFQAVLAGGCCALLLDPRPALAADGDAELIHRLTHYDLAVNSTETMESLAGQAALVYYAQEEWRDGDFPDRLEASDAELTEEGLVSATNGTLYINSLVEGRTIVASADAVEFDTTDGHAWLWGNVVVELQGTELRLQCHEFEYDPLMQRTEVSGVVVNVPLTVFVSEEELQGGPPKAVFGGHFYMPTPEHIRMEAARAQLDIDPLHPSYILYDTRLSHNDNPNPDLLIRASEMHIREGGQFYFRDIALDISGFTLFAWPTFSYTIHKERGLYDIEEPKIRFEKGNIAWKQGLNLDFGNFFAKLDMDYSPEYGLRDEYKGFVKPFPGVSLGVTTGDSSEYTIDRKTVEKRTDYNFFYKHRIHRNEKWFRDIRVDAEYGRMTEILPKTQTTPVIETEDRRLFVEGQWEFPLIPLGKDFYVTSGVDGRFVEYFDDNSQYRAVGAFGGVIWRINGFDHFIVYRSHQVTSDDPAFSFDKIRGRELDLMTSFRLHPDFRHVLRGIYDVDENELDQLAVSILKRQQSYEIGVFWDFARESLGLELGLLVE